MQTFLSKLSLANLEAEMKYCGFDPHSKYQYGVGSLLQQATTILPMLDFRQGLINGTMRKVLKRLHYPHGMLLTCVRWYAGYPGSICFRWQK